MNLFTTITFGICGIFGDIHIFILIPILYEIFRAPIRIFLDYKFSSYKRIIGVCTSCEKSPYRHSSRDIYGGILVRVSHKNMNFSEKFTVDAPSTIRKGQNIILIKGLFSRRILHVESHICDIRSQYHKYDF